MNYIKFLNCYKARYTDADGEHQTSYLSLDNDDAESFAQKIEWHHRNRDDSTYTDGNVQVWEHKKIENPLLKLAVWLTK